MAARRGRTGGDDGGGAPPAAPGGATTGHEAAASTPPPASGGERPTGPEVLPAVEPVSPPSAGDVATGPARGLWWVLGVAGLFVAGLVVAGVIAVTGRGQVQTVATLPTATPTTSPTAMAAVAPTVAVTTVAPTATVQPTATPAVTAAPTKAATPAPRPVVDAQASPDGVYYLRIVNPQARFEEDARYWLVQAHNGIDQTNVFVLDVPKGYVGVIQALELDGQGGGWVKAYPSGMHTVRAKSVFAGITLEKWAQPLFQERVDLAQTHNWARDHIEPLAQWKAAG